MIVIDTSVAFKWFETEQEELINFKKSRGLF